MANLGSTDTPVDAQSLGFPSGYSIEEDGGDLVLTDGDGVELIRQPKGEATELLQGADIDVVEAPEDSYARIINAPVTDSATAGDRVGYTFALDNQAFFGIDGEADGNGGIQNTEVTDGSNVIYDPQNNHVPKERVERVERLAYEPGVTTFSDGLSNEEVYRMNLESGEAFHVDRVELRQKGGGSSTDVTVDVYDAASSSVVASATMGSTDTSGGSTGDGATVLVRVSNSSGSAVDVTPIVRGEIK